LNFFCGFCKGDGGDSLYDDVVSKDCLWKWSRSIWQSVNCDF
jgi:hypothetical protein